MIDFAVVRRDHVLKALEQVREEGVPRKARARTTTLVDGSRQWPVKYILGAAYRIATGKALGSEAFSGGMAAGTELLRRGFAVRHSGKHYAPPPAIVSICIHGRPLQADKENATRIKLVTEAMDEIERHNSPVAAVVLPGGCFFLDEFIGDLTFEKRKKALESASFAHCCKTAAKRLRGRQNGALLVVGVDSIPGKQEGCDQLCVAWGDDGVVGIGRKVFPSPGEK